MTAPGEASPDERDILLLVARWCAIDPALGGMVLRGADGEAVAAAIRAAWPGAPVRRLPVHADDAALWGGLDLGATLARGVPVMQEGLFAAVEGGVLIVPMAERMSAATAGRIAQAIDTGAGFVTIALDEGGEDAAVPAALAERLAFRIDCSPPLPGSEEPGAGDVRAPRIDDLVAAPCRPASTQPQPLPSGEGGENARVLEAIATATAALGVDSARAPLFAVRAARASARLDGRAAVSEADLTLAVRLVLAPRATMVPAEAPPPAPDEQPSEQPAEGDPRALDDILVAAARTAIPADLLARLAAGKGNGRVSGARGAGERRRAPTRGRPAGVRAGVPRGGLRLALIDTLRAAAPWQRLRGRDGARLLIRRDDLRISRFEARAQATTIFAVDASGSSALARLAEAKGAVELLLAQAYVKRAQVALVAFRGEGAEILLPPTRSLARARRLLGDLPGGGGTPLAAGLDAAGDLARAARARGQTPFIVVLTDGRANVARDGSRAAAASDAEAAARAIGAAGFAAAFVDISPRPRPEGERLAAAMRARYLALPRADATRMHAAIAAVRP